MERVNLLDDGKGHIELIESWGSDERIIEAARMSTDKGFQGWGPLECSTCKSSSVSGCVWVQENTGTGSTTRLRTCETCKGRGTVPGDEKLLRYLWEHHHTTPFEMGGFTVEVQAPIFVFREWHRHRTQSYNELSARYTPLPDLYYTPTLERIMNARQSRKNKQGSETGIGLEEARTIQGVLRESQIKARAYYENLLAQGVAREIARIVVPVSQYSRMRASANLWNWLHFLNLRLDEAAQWEIRQYANEVAKIVSHLFPRTYELFRERT